MSTNTFSTLLHFGRGIFGADFGTVAFSIRKSHTSSYYSLYMRLFDKPSSVDSLEQKESWFFARKGLYTIQQENFSKIAGTPIAYWVSTAMLKAFTAFPSLGRVSEPKQGLITGDNDRFLREWYEVAKRKINIKWFIYNKGGDYRKWYGIPNILAVRELYASREPGRTCFRTLYQGECGTIDKPINDSKGCGGVMRVAPIGLFLHHDPMRAATVAADAAAVTHGHPSGYIPAALLAFVIACLINGADLLDALYDGLAYIRRWKGFEETTAAARLAIEYFDADLPADSAISEIGEGWVAEEALAIAFYCALKEPEPVRALRLSVNHDGDSDSTGAICGNLLGAMYGMSAFPREWIAKLEIAAFIAEMGDALYRAVSGAEATL